MYSYDAAVLEIDSCCPRRSAFKQPAGGGTFTQHAAAAVAAAAAAAAAMSRTEPHSGPSVMTDPWSLSQTSVRDLMGDLAESTRPNSGSATSARCEAPDTLDRQPSV